MSCTAPASARDWVFFDDESLSSFCFRCPTPHEAGKGPAVCFWHNQTSNWDSILLYNRCTWAHRKAILTVDRLNNYLNWKWLYPYNNEWRRETVLGDFMVVYMCSCSHNKPFEWCFPIYTGSHSTYILKWNTWQEVKTTHTLCIYNFPLTERFCSVYP